MSTAPQLRSAIVRAASLLLPLIGFTNASYATLFINEFHYRNAGLDRNERVEIVIGPDMAQLKTPAERATVRVDLYNGASGTSYRSQTLNNFVEGDTTTTGHTFYTFDFTFSFTNTADGNVQDGPDGLALSVGGDLIQFLSYGGVFTGSNGVADDVQSTNIGVIQASSAPLGSSLQLFGSGSSFSDFAFQQLGSNTFGSINSHQSFASVPEPSAFLFGGLVCGVLGLKHVIKRRAKVALSGD